ncbi:formate C-acetyltransferase/glycerol dehydratase family glycyl radical enzyme [Erysipelatoclostridium ramosum]|uniref:glycyl radical protein n=1 Tax=Thomasclavelia ramosa TaxID=1547 RepID=UPI001D0753FE|nr:formate C-acetyltransferase/glycerol dehydratase family glycyl radical enzyme [Thomasclavelia ramosa]MCB6453376.1 formate C-acetyltransferase/glycerol dehydratase family glycyl radical enzyme [Thomasclavelia ramosa]MCB7266941.1 formate C-acetyltransferase/glycerol dehydratase family glycyl radical enzyme [Thomasclavelia ramosa]MCB7428982.1 formate C-acetyltransferase/glycerol dehydratase family glycyl radical enzyme [Thomasclavelia ramosa]
MDNLEQTPRIILLKEKMLNEPRYVSIEQARIITRIYQENESLSIPKKRALSLKAALEELEIGVEKEELIVGNRTKGVRYGVVFPESGCSWVNKEFETLPTRPQDKFRIKKEDVKEFKEIIYPYWQDRSLEDVIKENYGEEINAIAKVVKINQKDHAQGHICPDTKTWLELGPKGLMTKAYEKLKNCDENQKEFYECTIIVLEGVCHFMMRYHDYILTMLESLEDDNKKSLQRVADICANLASRPAQSFHEAVQSLWFLFVVLHMESNASSFSPGRMDQYLYPYYQKDIEKGIISKQEALEILECLWLKFNQIVYLRNQHSAKYFAGFPIGFNIAIGGIDENGCDIYNELSLLLLKAQYHLGLPQPNLSVRLNKNSSHELIQEAIKVVAKGSGMPQFFNDEAIVNSMIKDLGIEEKDARNYAIVGCVELTTHGNNLGWSDAAMFNLNKALELTMNHGKCLLTNEPIGLDLGSIETYESFEDLENAFQKQIDYFIEKMMKAEIVVEKAHQDCLPTAFLSTVIDSCLEKGVDVTRGGAKYNLSGIQMIQIANLADSLAAIKELVYDEKMITRHELLEALQADFKGYEIIQTMLLNKVPKYGNDVKWVDELGAKWAGYFRERMKDYTNYRGGLYHTGMYTVSAHVPMGENVGASPDGRNALTPLADGGMSPVYGRDMAGPTAVLKSVSRMKDLYTTNGGLLNMKFLPEFFKTETGMMKFENFLRAFVDLKIPHIQFNVVRREDLLDAKLHPEQHRSLTIRVAGYTAYFVELAGKLQDEIIERTAYEDI